MAAPTSQGFNVDIDAMPKSSTILPPTSAPNPDLAKKMIPRKDAADAHKSLEPSSPGLRSMAAAQQSSSRRSSNARGSPPAAPHSAMASALGRSSPRHLSPATSQIFERDVQEPVASEASPAIPSHVLTEDHIPPVLEASSHAITENLDPDEVEIIQHAAHQTAAGSVAQQSGMPDHPLAKASQPDLSSSQSLPGGLSADGFPSPGAGAAGVPGAFPGSDALSTTTVGTDAEASSYGALNTQDPRRLSFISFADVVHAEHAEVASQTSDLLSTGSPAPRSPSPIRVSRAPVSPTRSALTGPGEASPVRGGAAGSFASGAGSGVGLGVAHGDIVVESMRSALQKTGSNGDAGAGTASQPLSATSAEDLSMPFTHK